MAKRTKEKWENQFLISKKAFESITDLAKSGNIELIRDVCVAMRNPVVFDNRVSEVKQVLPYYIPGNPGDDMVEDHLIGMSNIVLYIFKNKINERWKTTQDFMNTLFTFQSLLSIPKWMNNSKNFKSWQFDLHNIDDCIYWWKKLHNEGITEVKDLDGNSISVMYVWDKWYQKNKNYL
jgi:hypothetical protein